MEGLHYLLMKANANLNRRIMGEAVTLGLSPGQPKVLECLMELGESNQKTIAAFCEIEQATVGSILLRMERDGLVRRAPRDGNRRSLYVSLTPEGIRRGELLAEIFRRADALAAEGLTPEEQEQLGVLLEKVYRAAASDGRGER